MGRRTLETLVAAFPLIAALLAFHFVAEVAEGRWLYLPAKGTKCVSEEIHDNVVVLAVYFVVSDGHSHDPTLSVKGENVTHGQFAFTSDEAGNYEACFWVDSQYQESEVIVNLDWKIGIAAKDWESVAKKEKIKGVDLALRKLGGVVEDIHENLLYLRSRNSLRPPPPSTFVVSSILPPRRDRNHRCSFLPERELHLFRPIRI
ncbi:hypothetical protein SAY87_018811 [Trapa incisa]|uniref:GOLD domain-containing protein n=1 Tax=Trapa incisa TaxID=236973 RepID=A0AAN7K5C0_9MYRT|nr:hypothetical protein SAY87_018811 [Trapa incisa]